MKYTCPRCHYTTCKKSSMESHLHRRYGCEPLYSSDALPASVDQCKSDDVQNQPQMYRCKHKCGKSFNHASSLSRHYAVCTGTSNTPSESPKINNGTYQTQSVNGNNNNVNLTQVQINITPLSSMEPKLTHEAFTKLTGSC